MSRTRAGLPSRHQWRPVTAAIAIMVNRRHCCGSEDAGRAGQPRRALAERIDRQSQTCTFWLLAAAFASTLIGANVRFNCENWSIVRLQRQQAAEPCYYQRLVLFEEAVAPLTKVARRSRRVGRRAASVVTAWRPTLYPNAPQTHSLKSRPGGC